MYGKNFSDDRWHLMSAYNSSSLTFAVCGTRFSEYRDECANVPSDQNRCELCQRLNRPCFGCGARGSSIDFLPEGDHLFVPLCVECRAVELAAARTRRIYR